MTEVGDKEEDRVDTKTNELINMEEKIDFNLLLQQAFIDKKNMLNSFEELGYIDPTEKKSKEKTEK